VIATRRFARTIEALCWGFALLGLLLPFVAAQAPFAAWRRELAVWSYGADVVPAADRRLLGLMLGITGGSVAGKWVVHALVARGPLAEGRLWARELMLVGLGAWLLVEALAAVRIGADPALWFAAALPPVVLVALPLCLAPRRFFAAAPLDAAPDAGPTARASDATARACLWTAILGAATGPTIAFAGGTALFAPWFAGLAAAHYGGEALDVAAGRLALYFFGPVGACAFAQFLMLAVFLYRDGPTRRAAWAGTLSIAAWCAVDSAYGAAYDGLFNVAMVNAPALALTWPAWVLLLCRLPRKATN
jgi:hypothetical protein